MRILLVEDTDSLRHLFGRVLMGYGFEVCEASNGLVALSYMSDFQPELVLTDLMMPGLDGLGLIRRLRAMPEWDAVPVVAMTAVTSLRAERDARKAGAAAFLAKPINFATMLDCLGRYC